MLYYLFAYRILFGIGFSHRATVTIAIAPVSRIACCSIDCRKKKEMHPELSGSSYQNGCAATANTTAASRLFHSCIDSSWNCIRKYDASLQ